MSFKIFQNLSIFTKMLISPLIAITLFGLYIFDIYNKQIVSKQYVHSIQKSHFPIMNIANENIILLDNTIRQFQDAVGAKELEWLQNTNRYETDILNNLKKLQSLNIEEKTLLRMTDSFKKYFNVTTKLSTLMIKENSDYEVLKTLAKLMAIELKETKELFDNFLKNENELFVDKINITNKHGDKTFQIGIALGLLSLFLIITFTLILSLSTKRSLKEILTSMKDIADGNPDFSKRLSKNSDDELGKLVEQFNKFTQKLQIDYNRLSNTLQDLDIEKQKNEDLYNKTKDSIQYASLIQSAILADNRILKQYFNDSFMVWEPKDTVGGDIYLAENINENECLIYCIDCTGHGVPGAFVTMLVKAIQGQVSAFLENNYFTDISPAWIMKYFNQNIKKLLKQESQNSISNAGFDGGIIYYNKKEKIVKFSGANTSLFYIDNISNSINTIKGDRYSVGYKKCDWDYDYKEVTIDAKENMKFYITTDGYLDQNGGKKDFPFGKKRFMNIIEENHSEVMESQKNIFLNKLYEYEKQIKDNDRNDDITIIGFQI